MRRRRCGEGLGDGDGDGDGKVWMSVGDLVLGLKRTIFDLHPERPCALPTDPSWGTVV